MKINSKYVMVIIIMATFFIISFITNIIGPIIPEFIKIYNLNLSLASFLPLSFFLAYGIFSIPAGLNIEKFGGKKILILGFLVSFFGAFIISIFPNYISLVLSFFLIGTGMAVLQVVINPLLRIAVSGENFAFYSIIGQLVFGFASFLSPKIYSFVIFHKDEINMIMIKEMPWISIYWIFSVVSILMIFIISNIKFQKIILSSEEKFSSKVSFNYFLKNRNTYLYFFAIFSYVGIEQGINNWSSQFLYQYHDLDTTEVGIQVISSFWGNLTIGTVISLFLIKFFKSKLLLQFYALSSIILLSLALFADAETSVFSFKLMGLSISGIWSILIALGLNSVKKHHGVFSGILIPGIVGGAIFPFIIALLGDFFGLRVGMFVMFFGLVYILIVGLVAKPLVLNKTINILKK